MLTSVILMLAEFLPPDKEHPQERRHIVSVFKLVQDQMCIRDRSTPPWGFGRALNRFVGRLASDERKAGERAGDKAPRLDPLPVSYTHLDVYKRQMSGAPTAMC